LRLRAFTAGRMVVAPLSGLDAELRELHGHVLAPGCGYGVLERYLAEVNPRVSIDGIESDPARVAVAARTAPSHGRVTVRAGDVRWLESEAEYDAAFAIDVFHHLDADGRARLAAGMSRAVRPGGTVLVKEIATRPSWKHAVNRLSDRIVSGSAKVHCLAPDELAALLRDAGLEVESVARLAPLSPYPHYLVRAGPA
jgi:cyclopropane fatty-acyl-phospholipid synthase-like methyltransferase